MAKKKSMTMKELAELKSLLAELKSLLVRIERVKLKLYRDRDEFRRLVEEFGNILEFFEEVDEDITDGLDRLKSAVDIFRPELVLHESTMLDVAETVRTDRQYRLEGE